MQSANRGPRTAKTWRKFGAMVGTSHGSVSARPVAARLKAAWEATATFEDGKKMTIRELGRRADMVHTKVSRIFNGHIRPKPEEVALLCRLMGIPDDELNELEALTYFADGPQWMATEPPARAAQLRGLLALEQHAARFYTVNTLLVPGILQIPEYTEAIMRLAGLPKAEITARVNERSARCEILLRRDNPARLTAVIGEEALRKLIGGPAVMFEQLQELLSWMSPDRPNIDIRIIPLATDWHPALEGPYLLMEFDDGQPPVVHLETRTSGLFLHERADVDKYSAAVDTVRAVAMRPEESRDLIAHIAHQLEQTGSESVA